MFISEEIDFDILFVLRFIINSKTKFSLTKENNKLTQCISDTILSFVLSNVH